MHCLADFVLQATAPSEPDWKPAAWLYGGSITLIFFLRWIFRALLKTPGGPVKFGAGILAAGIYGAIVYAAVFAPEIPADIARHFGERPFGIPVRFLIWLVVTFLYIPFVFGARHVVLLTMVAHQQRYFGAFGLVRFYFHSAKIPELRHSRRITGFAAVYGLLLLVALGCLGAAWHDH